MPANLHKPEDVDGYKGYLATFNLRPGQHVHLVWHDGAILQDPAGLLEGQYPDRRNG
jgi:hypothetical protein